MFILDSAFRRHRWGLITARLADKTCQENVIHGKHLNNGRDASYTSIDTTVLSQVYCISKLRLLLRDKADKIRMDQQATSAPAHCPFFLVWFLSVSSFAL